MMRHIPGILTQGEVQEIVDALESGAFEPGANTATGRAKEVKNNLQLERQVEVKKRLDQLVTQGLTRNSAFMGYTFPRQIAPPLYNRYDVGMEYGGHVDVPVLNSGRMRADLSVTVFLSDPASYDGGELTVVSDYGEAKAKYPAGDAIVYSTTDLHHVTKVTRGSRLAAVSWVVSYVQDERARRILVDLTAVKVHMEKLAPQAPETDLLRNSIFNLMRLWWQS